MVKEVIKYMIIQNRRKITMKNYEKAYKLYERDGCSSVVDACNNGKLKYDKWGMCEPCELEQPIYDDACLVCGTIYINKKGNKRR
tara:strand:+ start:208 stop:462 length:255 start_codon:yes stop_codon:yes gene_type:complete